MLSIIEAAHQLGVHPDTLRRIERGGLFTPQRTRAGARRYSAGDLATLRAILYPPRTRYAGATAPEGAMSDGPAAG